MMRNKTTDEQWQEIQTRVEQLVDKYLRGRQALDHKPISRGHLPEEIPGNEKEPL